MVNRPGEDSEAADKESGRWVLIPFPDPVNRDTGLAWHYTDASGLLGILDNHGLWASATASLNDTSELQYGESVVRRVWESMRSDVPMPCQEFLRVVLEVDLTLDMRDNVFILSASLDGDLLNQWQHYARRGGFAVGLDVGHPLTPRVNAHGVAPSRAGGSPLPGWHRVIYAPDEQDEWARKMLGHVVNATPGNAETWENYSDDWPRLAKINRLLIQTLICQFKHPAFAAEREVRYLAATEGSEPFEHFRVTPDGRIVPYVVLDTRLSLGAGVLPIREVVCGPSSDPNAQESVGRLLRARGYSDVEVRVSAVPFR
jgi:hypothetical protein